MNENQYLIDGFYRAILLEFFYKSTYKDNIKIRDYILYDASHNKIRQFLLDKNIITEEMDVRRDKNLQTSEDVTSALMGLAAFVASPSINKRITNEVYKNVDKAGFTPGRLKGKKALAIGKFARGGTAGFLSGFAYAAGAALLTKVVFSVIRILVSKCRANCKKSVSPTIAKNRGLYVGICTSRCKIKGYQIQISRLKGQVAKCKETENPEKCQAIMVKQIGKLNDMVIRENKSLAKQQSKLSRKK